VVVRGGARHLVRIPACSLIIVELRDCIRSNASFALGLALTPLFLALGLLSFVGLPTTF